MIRDEDFKIPATKNIGQKDSFTNPPVNITNWAAP